MPSQVPASSSSNHKRQAVHDAVARRGQRARRRNFDALQVQQIVVVRQLGRGQERAGAELARVRAGEDAPARRREVDAEDAILGPVEAIDRQLPFGILDGRQPQARARRHQSAAGLEPTRLEIGDDARLARRDQRRQVVLEDDDVARLGRRQRRRVAGDELDDVVGAGVAHDLARHLDDRRIVDGEDAARTGAGGEDGVGAEAAADVGDDVARAHQRGDGALEGAEADRIVDELSIVLQHQCAARSRIGGDASIERVTTARFDCYGVPIELAADDARTLARMTARLPPGARASAARPRRSDFACAAASTAPMLQAFESKLALHVASHAEELLFVHAGVVGWRGRAIVLPGRTHAGKSTLVAALVRAGASYYSDEYALVDGDGRVRPYPRALSLRRARGAGARRARAPRPRRARAAAGRAGRLVPLRRAHAARDAVARARGAGDLEADGGGARASGDGDGAAGAHRHDRAGRGRHARRGATVRAGAARRDTRIHLSFVGGSDGERARSAR